MFSLWNSSCLVIAYKIFLAWCNNYLIIAFYNDFFFCFLLAGGLELFTELLQRFPNNVHILLEIAKVGFSFEFIHIFYRYLVYVLVDKCVRVEILIVSLALVHPSMPPCFLKLIAPHFSGGFLLPLVQLSCKCSFILSVFMVVMHIAIAALLAVHD